MDMYKYHSMDHLKASINMVPFYNAQLDDIKLNLKIMLSKIAQPHAQLANNEEMILN